MIKNKKIIYLVIFILLSICSYLIYNYNTNIYNKTIPSTLSELVNLSKSPEISISDKALILNYSQRFKNNIPPISLKELIDNEIMFEKSQEGAMFFNKIKEKEYLSKLKTELKSIVFITFVDFIKYEDSIDIVFSIKNKSSYAIKKINGDASFKINNLSFNTKIDFDKPLESADIIQVSKNFKYSEFPSLKDFEKNSEIVIDITSVSK